MGHGTADSRQRLYYQGVVIKMQYVYVKNSPYLPGM